MRTAIVIRDLARFRSRERAAFLTRFFKTGPGGYAEGDVFWGLTLPQVRSVLKKYRDLPLTEVPVLLASPVHEVRLTGLLILVTQFRRGDDAAKKLVYNLYMKHLKSVNNWDLVDLSAPNIAGAYLRDKPKQVLYTLAASGSVWDRRVAALACFHFIKFDDFTDALKIAEILLADRHDLIHKAVGWMLREIGKRNLPTEEKFLKTHYRRMPRTMLRYAIEKFPEIKRQKYLKGIL
ncbi:DNA alkylation repair protein [Candidatus Gottesmanbacteria bacterium RBG_16_52_11]|uniref:DNA alkylation repair protein n=1 Tax=Candidatus Gottesmanbacteria bacterium RBG_16_52_11 TaxID=1798374 RepID=A0A1F5YYV6_9BACT|nr:MAG: DNA alkylation repair protein [Candidatus Gottesmanbacteria bacterium RBG_16_52_11]